MAGEHRETAYTECPGVHCHAETAASGPKDETKGAHIQKEAWFDFAKTFISAVLTKSSRKSWQ